MQRGQIVQSGAQLKNMHTKKKEPSRRRVRLYQEKGTQLVPATICSGYALWMVLYQAVQAVGSLHSSTEAISLVQAWVGSTGDSLEWRA